MTLLPRTLPNVDPRRLKETLSHNGILFLNAAFLRRSSGLEDWTEVSVRQRHNRPIIALRIHLETGQYTVLSSVLTGKLD